MSTEANSQLLDRAREVSEIYVGTWLPRAIDNLIKENNLEHLEYMVRQAEHDIAVNDFHNYDVYLGTNVGEVEREENDSH